MGRFACASLKQTANAFLAARNGHKGTSGYRRRLLRGVVRYIKGPLGGERSLPARKVACQGICIRLLTDPHLGCNLPRESFRFATAGIVFHALLGITEDPVSLVKLQEHLQIPGVGLVGMVASRKKPIDTFDGIGFGVRA